MLEQTDPRVRRIYEQWHETTVRRDIEGLAGLYAVDGVFESPAVMALRGGDGILRGRDAIRDYFQTFFSRLDKNVAEWYRTGEYLTNGRLLMWEYPRQTPNGDQTDILESIDVVDGLIQYHRVYWGWVGFKTLLDRLKDQG